MIVGIWDLNHCDWQVFTLTQVLQELPKTLFKLCRSSNSAESTDTKLKPNKARKTGQTANGPTGIFNSA